jgi:phosphopantothenoylcysteine decarboxylase/phosphopantothenate--cysteine ligase
MRILVTAGPTREHLDEVRYLTNRSSGKMGFALARAAVAAGHRVVLVHGPVALPVPRGARSVPVVSARQMGRAVRARWAWVQALVMAAAVCDVRPRHSARGKLRKTDLPPSVDLVPNGDILEAVCRRKGRRVVMGFALEPREDLSAARAKRRRKGCDWMVVNTLEALEADRTAVTIVRPEGEVLKLKGSKERVAARLIRLLERPRTVKGGDRRSRQ